MCCGFNRIPRFVLVQWTRPEMTSCYRLVNAWLYVKAWVWDFPVMTSLSVYKKCIFFMSLLLGRCFSHLVCLYLTDFQTPRQHWQLQCLEPAEEKKITLVSTACKWTQICYILVTIISICFLLYCTCCKAMSRYSGRGQ